jgi:hypothetical protein
MEDHKMTKRSFLASAGGPAGIGGGNAFPGARAQAQWTFMVYCGGDNYLEKEGGDNLLQMAAAGPKAKI